MTQTRPHKPSAGWICAESNTYIRQLAGSEAAFRNVWLQTDGHADNCMGFQFTATVSNPYDAFISALVQLRLYAPIVAADIATCPEVPDSQCWIYQALPNGDSANSWARDTLTVHDPAPSDEEFIVKINQQRLPYVHPSGHKQYFGCHLLLRGDGRHSFYVHGSHVFLDARPALWILRRVFGAVVQGGKHGEPTHWGEEIANLPVDLHVAVGMMSTDVTNLPALDVPADLRMDEMSVGILPQRNTVTVLGRCVRVQRRLEKDMFAALRTQLKAHGLSVSMLCDAAHVLATLSMCHPLPKDAHVTLYFSVVALHRFLKAEYLKERYTTSCMTTVPLVVPAAKIPTDATPRARLLATMQLLKAQYAHWLAHPAFPLATELSAARPFTIKPNVFCPLVINLGVVDSDEYVPRTIRGEVGEIKMLDFVYGHRLTVDYSGMGSHTWTFDDCLYIRMQAVDTYDAEYLSAYLDTVVTMMLALLDEK